MTSKGACGVRAGPNNPTISDNCREQAISRFDCRFIERDFHKLTKRYSLVLQPWVGKSYATIPWNIARK